MKKAKIQRTLSGRIIEQLRCAMQAMFVLRRHLPRQLKEAV